MNRCEKDLGSSGASNCSFDGIFGYCRKNIIVSQSLKQKLSATFVLMHHIRLIEYGSCDYREMVALRDEILRKPLGLHFTEKYLQQEINDILVGCFETNEKQEEELLIGCCVLSPIDDDLVQLRQMAVRESLQRSGIGKEIMEYAEKESLKNGFTTLMMHARKTAVPFYERLGYQVIGGEFLEVSIPHFEMRKKL